MTGVRVVGVLLIVLGVVYALRYVGWLPRPRRSASAAGILKGTGGTYGTDGTGAPQPLGRQIADPKSSTAEPPTASGLPRALTLAWVEGTYLSTTMAISRQERVAAAGLGARVRATMVVDDRTVRWERDGADDVRVACSRLLGVRLERGTAGMLLGRADTVLVSWNADNGKTGDRYVTGFQPRTRADSAALVSAVQRLINIGASDDIGASNDLDASDDEAHTTPDGNP